MSEGAALEPLPKEPGRIRVRDWTDRALASDLAGRIAVGATLGLPVVLLYGRTLGEIFIGAIGIAFLVDRAARREWAWLKTGWSVVALAFWAWLVLCTLVWGSAHAIAEALAFGRLLILVAAMQYWVLRKPGARYLGYVVAAVAIWVALQCWQQELFGTNIFGVPRDGTGALSGPFLRPRAGSVFQLTFLAGVLPMILALMRRPGLRWSALATALVLLGGATSLIISQRMPLALFLLGICIVALAWRRFRLPFLIACACCALLLLASPFIAPEMYGRLVTRFASLLEHFMASPYGILFSRAVGMMQGHPWTGFGFDGFKTHCMDPAFRAGSSWLAPIDPSYALSVGWLPGGSPEDRAGCSIHPHNYWLQMGVSSGVPGLVLFAALAGVTLRGIWRGIDPARPEQGVCLFAAVATIFWPLASTTTMFALPIAGWLFFTIGWGLGEVRAPRRPTGYSP